MMGEQEIESRLRTLTARECKVLYWVFQGYPVKQIARALKLADQTISLDMTNIYQKLGLNAIANNRLRRQELFDKVKPVHQRLIANPDVDCVDKVFQVGTPPPPDPDTLRMVQIDIARGMFSSPPSNPQAGSTASSSSAGRNPPFSGGSMSKPPIVLVPQQHRNPIVTLLPWILVALLGIGVIWLWLQLTANSKDVTGTDLPNSVSTNLPSPTPIVITMVITATPPPAVAKAAPTTAVPAQPTYTPVPATAARANSPVATIPPAPTVSNVQEPPAGSLIPAGQAFSRNNVTIRMRTPLNSRGGTLFVATIELVNGSDHDITVVWSDALMHAKDDRGKTFVQVNQDRYNWGKSMTENVGIGRTAYFGTGGCNTSTPGCPLFDGAIDPDAKYLIFTLDKLAGMSNMNWRYDLQ